MLTVFFGIYVPQMLAFKDLHITINTQCYCGTLQNLIPPSSILACSQGVSPSCTTLILMWSELSSTLCPLSCYMLDHVPCSLGLSPCNFHVLGSPKKVLNRQVGQRHKGWNSAVAPAVAQHVPCRADALAGISMACLPECPW
jgi:hypothetical protein